MHVADQPSTRLARFGWHGWQLDVPAGWNPLCLEGDARTGRAVLADLDGIRVEMSWRRVRNAARVNLRRAVPPGSPEVSEWVPLDCSTSAEPDAARLHGQQARGPTGDVHALVLSRSSSRLLHIRIQAAESTPEPLSQCLLASLDDLHDAVVVPWTVYGFAWTVPRGFVLIEHHFSVGGADLRFRRRRETLQLSRTLAASGDTLGADSNSVTPEDGSETMPVAGHAVRLVGRPRGLLVRAMESLRAGSSCCVGTRLWGRVWEANWDCPHSRRSYRVIARSPRAYDLVRSVTEGVRCHHGETDPQDR